MPDRQPMTEAEIEAWRQDEELFAAIDRAWLSVFEAGPRPPWLPPVDTEAGEQLRAAFELGVLQFWDDIHRGRALQRRNRAASQGAAKKRRRQLAVRDTELMKAVKTFRATHGTRYPTSAMARSLARSLHPARSARTVLEQLRRLRLK
jgi:hypothetical protein